MFKRFFLQLLRSENRSELERNGLRVFIAGWCVLNVCLWGIPEQTSWVLVLMVNLWFGLFLVLGYD